MDKRESVERLVAVRADDVTELRESEPGLPTRCGRPQRGVLELRTRSRGSSGALSLIVADTVAVAVVSITPASALTSSRVRAAPAQPGPLGAATRLATSTRRG